MITTLQTCGLALSFTGSTILAVMFGINLERDNQRWKDKNCVIVNKKTKNNI
jgi:hypothetical protein